MGWMHNNKLRVNAQMPDDLPAETLEVYREHGWASGLHKDTDPDDRWSDVPGVLDPEPEDPKATKAKTKEG